MKIIRLTSSPADLPQRVAVALHADSSLLLPGHPFFMPEEEADWMAVPHLAVRICRLGKSISPRFADRYHDAMTVALHITTTDAGADAALDSLRDLADASVVLGKWGEQMPDSVEIGGKTYDTTAAKSIVNPLITALSVRTTFKTGDILLLPLGEPLPLVSPLVAPDFLNLKIV
ncbi:MAG: hypothetical protein K2K55_02600 [Duncaniella sp.]|nr:hypothetical protein [Duncaniella sp.]